MHIFYYSELVQTKAHSRISLGYSLGLVIWCTTVLHLSIGLIQFSIDLSKLFQIYHYESNFKVVNGSGIQVIIFLYHLLFVDETEQCAFVFCLKQTHLNGQEICCTRLDQGAQQSLCILLLFLMRCKNFQFSRIRTVG